MKRILIHALPVALLVLLFLAFSNDSISASSSNRSETDSFGTFRFQINRTPSASERNTLAVKIKLVNPKTEKVVYHSTLDLIAKKDKFVTPIIELKLGEYKLTEFKVVPRDENVSDTILTNPKDFVMLPTYFFVRE